jgi:mono/diheme cytochrome c family protein
MCGKWMTIKAFLSIFVLAPLLVACRQDMHDQPKYKPLAASTFFADGRSARPIPMNTVARGELNDDDAYHTGEANGDFLASIPAPVTLALLERGQDRYDIFCSPCHGRVGDGNGMVALRGFRIPADFDSERLRQVPPGYIYQVISNGYGAMPDYADQITEPEDRWAIVAYVRALQLSRRSKLTDAPPEERSRLEAQ